MSNPFDDILKNIPANKAAVATAPHLVTPCVSAPVPFSLKADLNPKKGKITSYLAVYNNPITGEPYLDSYLDYTEKGFMSKSVAQLNQARKRSNNPYLMLYLWQHSKSDVIGGVRDISEDSQGYFYVGQVNMRVQRGREAFALAEAKQIGGSSYGYNPVRFWHDEKDRRHLVEVDVLETSLVSFPANPFATVVDTKSRDSDQTYTNRLVALCDKMNASFDELEKQLWSMHHAFPTFPWEEQAYPSEVGQDISALLAEIQRQVR